MKQYLDLLSHVMAKGTDKSDRTGTGTRSVFGHQMRFDLRQGFPLLTTKKVYTRSIIHELLWFLQGDTNIKYLNENDVTIWDEWATEEGDLGPVYGKMWRSWPCSDGSTIDQFKNLIEQIKTNPDSRRLIITGWNPELLPDTKFSPKENAAQGKQALPPCHTLFQFYVSNPLTSSGGTGELSCQLYQRSADIFLGVPFNIASYSLLTHMIAQVCDLKVGDFIHTFGDAHIYSNHFEQVNEQLSRTPGKLPQLKLNPAVKDLFDFKFEDIEVLNYNPQPAIKAPISV